MSDRNNTLAYTTYFHYHKGMIAMCDFSGNSEPEMVKMRPVLILSDEITHRARLFTIIPLSTTPPQFEIPYDVKLSRNYGGPKKDRNVIPYAKCDMICSVSSSRLSRIRINKGEYGTPMIDERDFKSVIKGVKFALKISA